MVGVGTNLGAREAAIRGAARLLDARPGIEVVDVSKLYETQPLGPPQGQFLNAAIRVDTDLEPSALLNTVLRIERRLGRTRRADLRWGPRSVDLDLLWDARGPHESIDLQIPHRELEHRDFALVPLLDVAPELRPQYAEALRRTGAALAPWSRCALVRVATRTSGWSADVQADSLVDACALAVGPARAGQRSWSTRHAHPGATAEDFGNALRALLRSGFIPHCATVSHCSKSQWNVAFHGFNRGIPVDADVRLQTTSGADRDIAVKLDVLFRAR